MSCSRGLRHAARRRSLMPDGTTGKKTSVADMSRPIQSLAVVVILSILAFSTRALPLAISPYPFNNDGMTEARIASDILEGGDLTPPIGSFYSDTHSVITPAYDTMLAYIAGLVGYSPYEVAQYVVASVAVLTIVGIYLVALRITESRKGAIAAAMVLGLSGTFVFLTGSAWKSSLGVALLVLLMYAHMNRTDRRWLVLEITLLATAAIVHHLVAILAYLAIAYSTGVSVANAAADRRMTKFHRTDIVVITSISIFAFAYYSLTSLDSLVSLVSGVGIFMMVGVALLVMVAAIAVARARTHSRHTFAAIPATAVFAVFVWDYFAPIFPYSSGFPIYILVLGVLTAVLIAFGWYGLETALMSNSRYRVLPLIWLLPVVTLMMQALLEGPTLDSHQVIYRSFDFGYLAISIGVAATVGVIAKRPRIEFGAVACVLVVVLLSFPYGYMTNALEGIRHDTQEYEADALHWVYLHEGPNATIQSDERVSYDGRALYDFLKRPYVPTYLLEGRFPSPHSLNLFLEEWTTVGVNDYPNGHPVIDEAVAQSALEMSIVLYVGGPSDNNLIVFRSSSIGQESLTGLA